MENELKNKQKQEAIKRMKMLHLMPQVIKDFEKNNKVYYSERQNKIFNAILYWLDNNKEYMDLVKEFEEKYQALVYHSQLTHTEFGDMLSLLYVSSQEEEWMLDEQDLRDGYTFAYVINGCFSEFGTIGIRPSQGGILRVS